VVTLVEDPRDADQDRVFWSDQRFGTVELRATLRTPYQLYKLAEDVDQEIDKLTSTLKLGSFTAAFTASRLAPVDPFGAPTGDPAALLPSTLLFQLAVPAATSFYWKDRIKLETQVRAGWNWNLQRFTSNELTFNLNLSLTIYRFVELTFASESYNNRMYRYIPGYPEAIGESWVNPLYDLLRSFNLFNIDDRYASSFKVRKLSLTAVHQMADWDLRIDYQGKPVLRTLPTGLRQYEWDRSFTLLLEWKPLPLLKVRTKHKDKTPEPNLSLNVEELKRSEVAAAYVAQQIAWDLERRLPFRRTIKKQLESVSQNKDVKGVKIMVKGRLDGSEIARQESLKSGALPLQTLRANIDYGTATAKTTYGTIGVRVWIYKGEVFNDEKIKEQK